MKYKEREIVYAKALLAWGFDAQLLMLAEEAAELSVAAMHFRRRGKGKDSKAGQNLIEEIADVKIMIEQICYALDLDGDVAREIDAKIVRTKGKLWKTDDRV